MIDIAALRKRMFQLNQPRAYHLALTDEERQQMERMAWNHWTDFGRRLPVAPRLFFDLANRGTNMKYMEANAVVGDAWGAHE